MIAASPVLGNPANRNRAIPLTYEQFRFAFANAVSQDEATELYETFVVPAPGAPLFHRRHEQRLRHRRRDTLDSCRRR